MVKQTVALKMFKISCQCPLGIHMYILKDYESLASTNIFIIILEEQYSKKPVS